MPMECGITQAVLEGRLEGEVEDTTKRSLEVEILVRRESEEKALDTVVVANAVPQGADGGFAVQLGILPPGFYKYEGILTGGRREQKSSGVFAVESYSPEMAVIEPDSAVLARLARKTGGRFYDPLNARVSLSIGSTMESVTGSSRMAHNVWVYSLLIALLSAEWFLRRRKALS